MSMRAVFFTYLLLIVAGIVYFSVIGLLHQ
jgi:hypothetical protein